MFEGERRYGHLQDVEDARDFPVSRLVGATASGGLSSVDFVPLLAPMRDQLNTASCGGEATGRALDTVAKIAGKPIPYPSTLGIYYAARALDPMVTDSGIFPRTLFQQISRRGVFAEKDWPFDPAKVNEEPPWHLWGAGVQALVSGYYRVPNNAEAIRHALRSGYPLFFGMSVDDAYETYHGTGTYAGLTGPSKGGHAQCIVGFDGDRMHVCNSWGAAWGHGGLSWIWDQFFETDFVYDIYAVTVAPAVTMVVT